MSERTVQDWFSLLGVGARVVQDTLRVSDLRDKLLRIDSTRIDGEFNRNQHLSGTLDPTVSQSILDFGKRPLLQAVSRPMMGCQFEILLNQHQYATGVDAALTTLQLIEHIENSLSVYRPHSYVSKVNRFGSLRPVWVDQETLQLVHLAIDVHRWTGGAFDVTAGSLSEAWGFSRRQGSLPSPEQIQSALAKVGTQHLQVDDDSSTIALSQPGMCINTGGIGKGYALDRAAELLLESGVNDFMIHGGLSSIVAYGRRSGPLSNGWKVALKHPWRWEETLETFTLHNQALGTSGSGKQYFHFGGRRYSHLIDPRSGWPADQMMSATVICPSAAVADSLATGLFILGPQAARDFCQQHPTIRAILVYTAPKSGSQKIEHCNWSDQ
ncbi:MAG: FAD:protein FMN transferase [Pirellulaceae bacterium]|nr:FAD:protein FMN transferase [Pirellulaceae bacterium]